MYLSAAAAAAPAPLSGTSVGPNLGVSCWRRWWVMKKVPLKLTVVSEEPTRRPTSVLRGKMRRLPYGEPRKFILCS
jgi:hypothetical protein